MGRNLLKLSIVVLSLLLASAAAAEDLIQNGGFESGDLFPWEEVGDRFAWGVTDSHAYEGSHSALVRGPYQLGQSFVPVPGSMIEAFSVTVMTGVPAWVRVEIGYNDAMNPIRVDLFVPEALAWETFDLLEYIDPDRDVCRVLLSGHQNGDSPNDMRAWFDAVILESEDPDDPVEDPEDVEALEAATKKVKVKFNTKRERTRVVVSLLAEELPDGIHEGPVEITVLLSQDGFTTAFEAEAQLVDVPHRKDHIIRLMDEDTAEKVKCRE
jgi:hypothetical protein